MTDPPRKPWWRRKRAIALASVLIVLAYPLSFVPACWVLMRTDPMTDVFPFLVIREIHRPTAAVLKVCPESVRDAVRGLIDLGSPDGLGMVIDPTVIGVLTEDPFHDTGTTFSISILEVW